MKAAVRFLVLICFCSFNWCYQLTQKKSSTVSDCLLQGAPMTVNTPCIVQWKIRLQWMPEATLPDFVLCNLFKSVSLGLEKRRRWVLRRERCLWWWNCWEISTLFSLICELVLSCLVQENRLLNWNYKWKNSKAANTFSFFREVIEWMYKNSPVSLFFRFVYDCMSYDSQDIQLVFSILCCPSDSCESLLEIVE